MIAAVKARGKPVRKNSEAGFDTITSYDATSMESITSDDGSIMSGSDSFDVEDKQDFKFHKPSDVTPP